MKSKDEKERRKEVEMNIAFFIKPKNNVNYLYDDNTLRQGLEKMQNHGFTAVPVISRKGEYVGTISEGDFLWSLIDTTDDIHNYRIKNMENIPIKAIMTADRNPPVRITASMEELLTKSMSQNFVPVVDDRGYFMGIITRKDIIGYFYDNMEEYTRKIV